jgi:hypothetical protein
VAHPGPIQGWGFLPHPPPEPISRSSSMACGSIAAGCLKFRPPPEAPSPNTPAGPIAAVVLKIGSLPGLASPSHTIPFGQKHEQELPTDAVNQGIIAVVNQLQLNLYGPQTTSMEVEG